jgi:hypothetical protein
MKGGILFSTLLLCQAFFSHLVAGQTLNLGAASTFALFTGVGNVSNTGGLTGITGDVGTNGGAMPGWSTNQVNGAVQHQNQATIDASRDVLAAYNYLVGLNNPVVPAISAAMGGPELTPQVLTPAQYRFGGAVSVNDVLVLDGQNNPNAVFVFQINGALTSGAGARIKLINGTTPNHVFWQVNGAAAFAALTRFSGVIIASGAISFGSRARLEGKALSVYGDVTTYHTTVAPTLYQPSFVLGAASTFALFTGVGAVGNTGPLTSITGDIGTHSGAMPGWSSNQVNGAVQHENQVSYGASRAVLAAYGYLVDLDALVASTIPAAMGGPKLNPQVLIPGQYRFGGAASVDNVLVLDGQNNPNAVFVFQVNGALTIGADAQVQLINGATPNHILWQVNGAAAFAAQTQFAGIIVADAAISFGDGAQLRGKALSVNGAIAMYNNNVTTTNSTAAPLPVELTHFSAVAQGAGAHLTWGTASEKNCAYFGVERSADGRVFATLARVAGQGTTTLAHAYSWTDASASASPTVYYRLRQVDTDGTTSYSPVRQVIQAVAGTNPLSAQAYPNPGQSGQVPQVLFETTQAGVAHLRLSNALGHVLCRRSTPALAGRNSLALYEAAVLPAGLYFLQLRFGNQHQTLRLVRQ